MIIELVDDGSLDTVLRCEACGQELRFNYQTAMEGNDGPCEHGEPDACATCYDEFVQQCMIDFSDDHEGECPVLLAEHARATDEGMPDVD